MREYLPILIVGAIVGVLSVIFLIAYITMKDKKEAIGFDRNMKDGEIARRLLQYAKPHVASFAISGVIMLAVCIAVSILSGLAVFRLTKSSAVVERIKVE